LPCLARLLRVLEAVLPPVHDADDDGARFRRDLDEIQAGFVGDASSFFEGNDADLLSTGADETDGTEADLIVHPDFFVDSTPPSGPETMLFAGDPCRTAGLYHPCAGRPRRVP